VKAAGAAMRRPVARRRLKSIVMPIPIEVREVEAG
jgi:hypothetical protein